MQSLKLSETNAAELLSLSSSSICVVMDIYFIYISISNHLVHATTANDDSKSSGADSGHSQDERKSSGAEFWLGDGPWPKRIDANECWLDDRSGEKRMDANDTNDEWLADRSGA